MKKISIAILAAFLCGCSAINALTDTDNIDIVPVSAQLPITESIKNDSPEADAPPMLTVHYYFEEKLSKEEADVYINGIESTAEVSDTIDLSGVTVDNFSSNFLEKGTKLYFVNEGIVAVYDGGDNYYAALLSIGTD